jgi:hypothetical protein
MGEKPLTLVKDFSVIVECNIIERIPIVFSRYGNSTVFHNLVSAPERFFATAQNDNPHVSVTLSKTKSLVCLRTGSVKSLK